MARADRLLAAALEEHEVRARAAAAEQQDGQHDDDQHLLALLRRLGAFGVAVSLAMMSSVNSVGGLTAFAMPGRGVVGRQVRHDDDLDAAVQGDRPGSLAGYSGRVSAQLAADRRVSGTW